jgi:hypothetical protein
VDVHRWDRKLFSCIHLDEALVHDGIYIISPFGIDEGHACETAKCRQHRKGRCEIETGEAEGLFSVAVKTNSWMEMTAYDVGGRWKVGGGRPVVMDETEFTLYELFLMDD